jgi:hypothetical protein
MNPSLLRTRMPTMNTTRVFTEISCSSSKQEKEYCRGSKNGTNSIFRITASAGIVKIIGNEDKEAKNVYVLYCPKEKADVIIENFRTATDIISVIHLSKDGYSYSSLKKISYSVTSEQPLTLLFCSENRLQVILSAHTQFDLQDENFLFVVRQNSQKRNHDSVHRRITFRNIMIVCGFLFFLAVGVYALSYQNNLEEKKRLEEEEKWLNPVGENGAVPVLSSFKRTKRIRRARKDKSVEEDMNNSMSSSCTVVVAHQNNEKNDELKMINESGGNNICQEETVERNQQSTSVPSSTITGKAKSVSRADISEELISSINSDDWGNALVLSDDDNEDVLDQEDQSMQEKSASDEWENALALSDDDICEDKSLDDHSDQSKQERSTTTVLPLVLSIGDQNINNKNLSSSVPVQIHDLHSGASSLSSWSSDDDEEEDEDDDESLRLSLAELSSLNINDRIYDDHRKIENSGRNVRSINSNEWEDAIVSSSEDER